MAIHRPHQPEPTEAARIDIHYRPDSQPAIRLTTHDNRTVAYTPTPAEVAALIRVLAGWLQAVHRWPDLEAKFITHDRQEDAA